MPYALCPMPYAQSYLIFLRKAIALIKGQGNYCAVLIDLETSKLIRACWIIARILPGLG